MRLIQPSDMRTVTRSILMLAVFTTSAYSKGAVNFSRDVLPLLSDRCFHCHGPDESHRKAELRLDLEDEAKAERDGEHVIKPGDPEASLLWQRIITDDPDDLMPPVDSHREALSPQERNIIRDWIADGAPWGKHWSFEKPVRPELDGGQGHPVDQLVDLHLKRHGLKRSRPAEAYTQLRRLSFGLTGLPPSSEAVKSAGTSISDSEWKTLVNELLASPHYGERMAMWWLDAARYSDTDGFQQDATRQNWPWRDWVVRSFNSNMPFDQFTIEQFAGDLLPNATDEQKLATCFHRNHMTNGEGGRHKEESRIDYVIDRVNTTGTAFLGLTLGCVQCHAHKFDPISHEDYYSLFAFFNSIDEDGAAGGGAKPHLSYTPQVDANDIKLTSDYLASWKLRVEESKREAEERFADGLGEMIANISSDHKTWYTLNKLRASSEDGTEFELEADGIVQTTGPQPKRDHYLIEVDAKDLPIRNVAGWKLEVLPHESHKDGGLARGGDGNFTLEGAKLVFRNRITRQETVVPMNKAVANLQSKGNRRTPGKVSDVLNDDPRNGWRAADENITKPHVGIFSAVTTHQIGEDEILCIQLEQRPQMEYATIGRFRLSITSDRGEHLDKVGARSPLEDLAVGKPEDVKSLDPKLRQRLLDQYLLSQKEYQTRRNHEDRLNKHLSELKNASKPKKVQVLARRKDARKTHVLERGVWDAKGKEVRTAVLPAVLDWPADKTKTRKDLADWIVHQDNPLTARVIVNQIWMNLFGHGLVRKPEDFGLQGEQPTHPELLDWLAVEFMESGWDVKHLARTIVTSETYRQSSEVSKTMLERDPENRLLARATRFRLPAWMIRDNALATSGLLNDTLGGPPVFPWQPEGVWNEIFMGRFSYVPTLGPSQYRRTLYTFWRRSSAPTFLFDSAQRRSCEIRQRRTNTPLHALTLLNDVTMMEASRSLANAAVENDEGALLYLGRKVLGRELSRREQNVFKQTLENALDYYDVNVENAVKLTAAGQQEAESTAAAPEVAAWMVVASTMLNLDEAITHE